MSKRILVTGGLGTVGSGLIEELRNRGHHVVSCDISHQPDEVSFSVRTDVAVPLYARCDVGEFRQLERVFERLGPFGYVYHCASEFPRLNGEDFLRDPVEDQLHRHEERHATGAPAFPADPFFVLRGLMRLAGSHGGTVLREGSEDRCSSQF